MSDAATRVAELDQRLRSGDFESLRSTLADEYFGCRPATGTPSAADRITDLVVALQDALPDLTASLEGIAAQDDGTVTASMTARGTHRGNLWGAPGSGAEIEWTAPVTFRPVGDRVAVRFDDLPGPQRVGLIRQLHLVNPADEMDQPPHNPIAMPEFLLRLVFTGEACDRPCTHLDDIRITEPTTNVCHDCVDSRDIWPVLRMCLVCGYVGCCDTSKNRHMAEHYRDTGHPIFRSIHRDEGWIWCYADDAFFDKSMLTRH